MSQYDNIKIVREYIENHNPHCVADDVILHDYSQPEPLQGRQALEELIDTYLRVAFSDTTLEMRNITADAQRVTIEFIFHGVNTGSLMGQPPTGKRLELPVCGVCDIEDGVISRLRFYYDTGLIERQLGWVPRLRD